MAKPLTKRQTLTEAALLSQHLYMHPRQKLTYLAKNKVTDRPLRVLNVHCQSLKNKQASFRNFIDSTQPRI